MTQTTKTVTPPSRLVVCGTWWHAASPHAPDDDCNRPTEPTPVAEKPGSSPDPLARIADALERIAAALEARP
jgi:hypothetical protein